MNEAVAVPEGADLRAVFAPRVRGFEPRPVRVLTVGPGLCAVRFLDTDTLGSVLARSLRMAG